VTSVTFGGIQALGAGGGLRSNNGGGNTASVSLNNVTIYTNTADYDTTGTGHGGGVSIGSGTVSLQNTLIAGNADKSSSSRPDCSGTLTTNGYNLLGNNTGCTITATTGDQVGTITNTIDAKLGLLANNGGPSLTYALLAGSVAIDAANPATPGSGGTACAATDQRWALRPADGDGNGTAVCDIGAYEAGASAPGTGVVISYLYDKLYRLSTAIYSTGEVFTYTYDAVGNRLADSAPTGATTYTYDDANRLATANGTSYTWDANGNLLADGVLTYTYDTANRLTAINASLYTFGYNGLGDRLLQNANGTYITDTLDLAAGLVQVLSEKKGTAVTTYVYGAGRLAQRANAGTEYFLADGLRSVRGLAGAGGSVTLQKCHFTG
jgi:YD repeat-containing protein